MHLVLYRTNIVLLVSAIAFAGCAAIPIEPGFSTSAALIIDHGGPAVTAPDLDADAKRQTAA